MHRHAIRHGRPLAAFLFSALSAAATPSVAADLEITGMEVTQTIQDLDSSVRLVAKKDTWVRVHVRSLGGAPIDGVVTRIVASRVAPGPVQFLGAIDSPPRSVPEAPFRPNIDSSFNIQIPYAWRSGTVHVIAVVDFPDDIDEDNEENNILFQAVTFESTPPLRVRMIGVDTPNGNLPVQKHYDRTASWLRRSYPTSALLLEQKTMVTPINVNLPLCNCTRDPMTNACTNLGTCLNMPGRKCNDDDQDCGCAFLNEILLSQRKMDAISDPSFAPDRRYAAIVDDQPGFMRGCSPGVDAKVASGPSGTGSNGWDFDGSYTDWYTAHELGHAYGRPHAGCCGAANGGPYPWANCAIGDDSLAGFDSDGPKSFSSGRRDVMSYCNSLWTSDFTFEAILDQLQLEGGAPPPPLGVLGNFKLVVGNAKLDLDVASMTNVQAVPTGLRAVPATGSGEWELRFLDGTGGVLSRAAITPHELYDDHDFVIEPLVQTGIPAPRTAVFAEIVEVPAGPVASLGLFHDGVELDSRVATANAPEVTITAPNGGESIGRATTVTWTASDPDGDALTASVWYSADDGGTWKQLASQISGTSSLDIDLEGLPGGALARFRVDVSDGYLGASDSSDDVFTVANALPRVSIVAPGEPVTFAIGQTAMFEGSADDAEDGTLEGASLEWRSDRQGVIGSGTTLEIADDLVPGTHEITLRATDSDGNEAESSVTIVKGSESADLCPASPRDDCDDAVMSRLKMRDRRGAAPPQLAFAMTSDTPREAADLGQPDVDTTEALCLYAGGRLRDAIAIAPSATQWKGVRGQAWLYRAPGSGSVERAALRAGAAGSPAAITVRLRGKGSGVPAPESDLDLPIVVQYANSSEARCVSAAFGPSDVKRNARRDVLARH